MVIDPSRILIIEDDKTTSLSLEIQLEKRGFEVKSFASSQQTRNALRGGEDHFDVAVLDMRLSDSDPNATTGAQLGLELKKTLKNPPEFLIYSGHAKLDYFRQAYELLAAHYLDKGDPENPTISTADVALHVAGLALRRRLQFMRPTSRESIADLARKGGSPEEVTFRFCNELLMPQIKATIKLPTTLVMRRQSQGEVRLRQCGDQELPLPLPALEQLTHPASLDMTQPVTYSHSELLTLGLADSEGRYSRGVSLIPLAEHPELSLSLLIAEETQRHDAEGYGRTILRYCLPSVLQHIFDLGGFLAEEADRRRREIERRKVVLANTADIILKVGQEILFHLQEWRRAEDSAERESHLEELEVLANNLRDSGEMIEDVDRTRKEYFPTEFELRDLIGDVWQALAHRLDDEFKLSIIDNDNVSICGDYENIYLALTELFNWLFHLPRSGEANLSIELGGDSNNCAYAVFRCPELRITRALTQRVVEPVEISAAEHLALGRPLGLFVARVLLDMRSDGYFQELSEEDGSGLFRLMLPSKQQPQAA